MREAANEQRASGRARPGADRRRRAAGVAATCLLTALPLVGCNIKSEYATVKDGVPNDAPITCPVRVYLLRGLWDVFSIGLESLSSELQSDDGVMATPITGPDWRQYLDEIVADYKAQGANYRLVLIGHSFGADDAMDMSHGLQDLGVPVKLMILFDATDPTTVPDNVERAIHLYIPTRIGDALPKSFAGNPIEPDPGNTISVIDNIVVDEDNFGPTVVGLNHFHIDSDPTLHEYAVSLVGDLCP